MMKFKDLNLNFSACGFLFQQNNSMYVLLTKREVKVAGYWHNEANIQPFWWTGLIVKGFIIWPKRKLFHAGLRRENPREQDGLIGPYSSISNHTNATSHLPIEHFSHLFFSMVLVNKSEY